MTKPLQILPALLLAFAASAAANPLAGGWLAQAESDFLAQRYDQVIETCDRIISAAPQVNDAHFLRGMSHYHLDRPDLARNDLEVYQRGEGNYLEEAGRMLRVLDKQLARDSRRRPAAQPLPDPPGTEATFEVATTDDDPESGDIVVRPVRRGAGGSDAGAFDLPMRYRVSAGAHWDSRVLLRPENGELPDDPEVSDTALALRGNAQWRRDEGGPVLRYTGDWLLYNKARRESRLGQAGEAGWHWTFDDEAVDLELVGFGQHTWLDFEEYRRRYGARFSPTRFSGVRRDWLQLSIGDDTYDEFSDYNGTYWMANAGQDFVLGDWILGWNLGYLDQSAALPEVEFTETIVGTSLRYSWTDQFQTGAGLMWIDNPYDRYDPVFEDQRDDEFITAQVWLRYALSETVSIEPSLTYIQRDSSVDRLGYDRFIAEINTVLSRW